MASRQKQMGGFVEDTGFQLHIGNFRPWLDKRLKGIQGEWTASSLCEGFSVYGCLKPEGFLFFSHWFAEK